MAKKRSCAKHRCDEPPYMGGLCRAHYEKQRKEELEEDEAREVLKTFRIDGKRPEKESVMNELLKANNWLEKAYSAMRANREEEVLLDETRFAPAWCIAISKGLIDEERAYREGRPIDFSLAEIKKACWKRFENLEAGLMSNGIERPTTR